MTDPAEIARECDVCGALYRGDAYRITNGKSRTCSRSCAGKLGVRGRHKPTDDEIIKFLWSRVERRGHSECWPWHGPTTKDARGVLSFRGFRSLAPRVAYRAKTGEWPRKSLFICHSCDNPNCCNPDHLWEGTARENVADMNEKGRGVRPYIAGWQRSLTHCKHGHEFTQENTSISKKTGRRKCRTCQRQHHRDWEMRRNISQASNSELDENND